MTLIRRQIAPPAERYLVISVALVAVGRAFAGKGRRDWSFMAEIPGRATGITLVTLSWSHLDCRDSRRVYNPVLIVCCTLTSAEEPPTIRFTLSSSTTHCLDRKSTRLNSSHLG